MAAEAETFCQRPLIPFDQLQIASNGQSGKIKCLT